MKRAFDIIMALLGLIILSPFLLIIALLIVLDSSGGVFYKQKRVGKNNQDFSLIKFRTMHTDADKKGLLTVGTKDLRITKTGYYLRKYKLDELPQLFNVLKGDMSFVGPRPEVRQYVDLYNDEQKKVLQVKPGITDYASIAYINENEMLAAENDPEKLYIQKIMPDKLQLNLDYLEKRNFFKDLKVIFKTLAKIASIR